MNTRTLFILLNTMMSGAAIAADETQFMTLDAAQQASGRADDEVRAADINGDRLIDTAEFAALTAVPEEGDTTKDLGMPAVE